MSRDGGEAAVRSRAASRAASLEEGAADELEESDGAEELTRLPEMRALNERQRRFVLIYLTNGFRGASAARAAGYATGATQLGSRLAWWLLYRHTRIRRAVRAGLAVLGFEREDILRLLLEMACGVDPADFEPFLRGDCSLEELRERGVNTHLLRRVTVSRSEAANGRVQERLGLEFPDRLAVLDRLARLTGLDGKRGDGGKESLPDLLAQAEAEGVVDGDGADGFDSSRAPPDGDGDDAPESGSAGGGSACDAP